MPPGSASRRHARAAQDCFDALLHWTPEIGDIHREFERRIGFPIPLAPVGKAQDPPEFSLIKIWYILVR